MHLLLILALDADAGLNTLAGLDESLSLGHFTWVVREYAGYVGAQVQKAISPQLKKKKKKQHPQIDQFLALGVPFTYEQIIIQPFPHAWKIGHSKSLCFCLLIVKGNW